ncbi:DUF1254 domain-containing protein [Bartonella sp. CB178]|uniref:DUF1254 domain-containing protein n=1 Tax=Bartonella sp. CB178 TaxID=3112255 RepID=UPI00300E4A80
MTKFIRIVLLISLGAIISHIFILFSIPYYAQSSIWEHLKKSANYHQFAYLDPSDPIYQSSDPLFIIKVCRFNLANGPVHLRAMETTRLWSLSAYTSNGIIFYSVNDRTAPDATLNLVIGKPIQIIELKKSKPKNSTNSVLVAKDLNEGFAILRAFSPSPITEKESEIFLSSATCRVFNE